MKLYIWDDPFKVDYGSSLLFAVANNEQEAKEIAAKSKLRFTGIDQGLNEGKDTWTDNGYYGSNQPPTLTIKQLVNQLGPPTRILDLPCTEWHVSY